MKLSYAVIKNTIDLGHLNKEELVESHSAENAVRYAKQLQQTEFTWYTVAVKF